MIPSLVASEVEEALLDFLSTQFQPSNRALSHVIDGFLGDRANSPKGRENFLKGPYLSIALPFRRVLEGGEPFPGIPLGFTPYRHQRTAFERLSRRESTVVATGTGSGKTECFLYPILESCRRRSGEAGIKAIVIYPMNALATDQAGRIAAIVHSTEALRGRVTAGIYVGQDGPSPHDRMTAKQIVSNHHTLVEQPPDILLTNYKMLDYLLSRPSDQRLWRRNGPSTLSWLVVDELHTFDGAQGTDLACLIRRLKARLGTTSEDLTCVGTSATLGDAGEEDLRKYVGEVFGTSFEPGSIVGETRETIDEFLGNSLISDHLMPRADLAELTDHRKFESSESYIRAQFELFFGEGPGPGFLTDDWKVSLADRLRGHSAFLNLLRTLEGRPKSLSDIIGRLRRSFPCRNDQEAIGILNGLCALISVARISEGDDLPENLRPFLRVSLHLWVRELGRMVCSLHEERHEEPSSGADRPDLQDGGELDRSGSVVLDSQAMESGQPAAETPKQLHRLRHSDDIGPNEPSVHLPLIQCHNCRVTGWGTVLDSSGDHVRRDLRHFYNHYFARDLDVRFLFPEKAPSRHKGHQASACGTCGHFRLGEAKRPCSECGADRIVDVFVPAMVGEERRGGQTRRILSLDCPYCGSDHSLFIFGARSSVLLSVALGQTYASRHNDDRKVIAFSDNVQDAAHRAGFFSHRTWRNSKRAAIIQALPEHGGISLADLPGNVIAKWSASPGSENGFGPERFVEQFIAPDRTWQREFKEFQQTGRLESKSRLHARVVNRLEWEALAELGFASSIAHSLERARAAAAGPDIAALVSACDTAALRIREEISELASVETQHVQWVALGVLRRMKDRGAIFSDRVEGVAGFLASGGNRWALTRNLALPEFGPTTPYPVFPSDSDRPASADGIESLVTQGGASWYQRWVERVLRDQFPVLAAYHSSTVLRILLESLKSHGLAKFHLANGIPVWAIAPECFLVTRNPAVLYGSSPTRALVVPRDEARLWLGAPCLELGILEAYERAEIEPPTWIGRMYREATIQRIVAEEHTALLKREHRERLQRRFSAKDRRPWDPNMLSATPTLELGIDIGDLSTVAICSVPPAQANYLQRIGRAGRRDGNAFTVTLAAAKPHDLFFYAEPSEMLDGGVRPPGVILNAPAVLERQLTSFCFDNWAASYGNPDAVPKKIRAVLDHVDAQSLGDFPYTFFSYTSKNAKRLLRDFLAAFEGSLTDDSKDSLRRFLLGEPGERPQLEVLILQRLEQVVKERRSIRRDMDKLRERLRQLGRNPQDDAVEADKRLARRERAGLSKLLAQINDRDTFGFLTDEGLIPNYAFPEEGVTLRSVILRRPSGEEISQATPQQSGSNEDLEVFEYLRPAAAALSELAPNSRFYAGGHRVEIDRVDLDVTSIEQWRLCPSCPHCRRIDDKDEFSACPKCGDPMWADSGQARRMLPLRLVHATTPARRAQIMDDRDDRESLFFTRHLVADFDPNAQVRAYAVPPPHPSFAFEYAPGTTFREMNFGRLNSKGQPTKFAGKEIPREGFKICRFCGKVQSRRPNDAPQHTLGCNRAELQHYAEIPDTSGFGDHSGPHAADPAMVDCLYLYREFESESLRMLIPVIEAAGFGPRVQSFIAAVELGLRETFGGRVDHLRAMTGESPESEGSLRRNYLILYDTVPGGTGYLKQLTEKPGEVVAVLQAAQQRLRACDCDDGCYRCVFAYRRSHEMERTSKRLAIELLDQILEHAGHLERVPTIECVPIEGLLESKLEARFIEALERRETIDSSVRIRQEIVRGKAGYIVTVGKETWYVEPQADLNQWDGVLVGSRPDFLFRPAKPSDRKRPVAVFLDGFQYHKRPAADDSIKRMALVRGDYLQWSLTWHDVDVAFGGNANAPDLIRGLNAERGQPNQMRSLQEKLDSNWSTGPLRGRLRESSYQLLLRYLGEPDSLNWKRAVFTDMLRIFDRSSMGDPSFKKRFESSASKTLPSQAADALSALEPQAFFAGRGSWLAAGFDFADVFVALPGAAINNGDPDKMFAAVHLHDCDPDREGYREIWNSTLRLFNLIQFLPVSWWTTSRAVSQGGYPEFARGRVGGLPASKEWVEAIDLAGSELRELLECLSRLGVPPPVVGYELQNNKGLIVGEAEIAWADSKVAVLTEDQEPTVFEVAGWRVWMSDVSEDAIRAALTGNAV